MLRYLLILLLINTYGRSLGTPVLTPGSNGKDVLIADLLSDLMKECKNDFAYGQIANSLKECNVTAPLFYEIPLQCLVFLDASSLLCNISAANFPSLATDFKAKTSGKLSVDEFCAEAAHFSPLPTKYPTLISQVFKGDALCKKVCMDKDVLSGDTHFFCKYYKWSIGIFKTPASSILNSTVTNVLPVSGAETGEGKPGETVTTIANNTATIQVNPEINVSDISSINTQNNQLQSHLNSSSNGLTTSVHNHFSTNQSNVKPSQPEDNHETPTPQKPTGHDEEIGDGESHADTMLNQVNPVIDSSGQRGPGISNIDPAGSVLDHPDLGPGDIGDGEREGDNDADDEDMEPDLDVRNSQLAPNTQSNPIGGSSQRDYLPNLSESYTEDDDHFFPLFLTAVILAIVLYVLYHNKSKVGKMFFGLIVEGRQPGRRRNSRGHSYRRLDTLEQAMSGSAPAPPSKIIY